MSEAQDIVARLALSGFSTEVLADAVDLLTPDGVSMNMAPDALADLLRAMADHMRVQASVNASDLPTVCPKCQAPRGSEYATTTCGMYHANNDCPMRGRGVKPPAK